MHPDSCTNTHHNVTDLLNRGMDKNTKTWISWERNITFRWEGNITFIWNKNILNLCLRWHILRSYRFVEDVTFKLDVSIPFANFNYVEKNIFCLQFVSDGPNENFPVYALSMCVVMSRFAVFSFLMLRMVESWWKVSAVGLSICQDSVRTCDSRDLLGAAFLPEYYNIFITHFILCFGILSPFEHRLVSSFNSLYKVASSGFSAGGSSSVFFPRCVLF